MKQNKINKGFTLIELLVVIAIIGLLVGIVVVNVNSTRAKARDALRITDLQAIRSAVNLYRDANGGNAPADLTDLSTVLIPDYLDELPVDPSSDVAYTYSNAGNDGTFFVSGTTEQPSSVRATAGLLCGNSVKVESASGSPEACTER